ncbi:MAG: DUF6154 family protein [Firmicutes bacterium]|nr:DUF6154 family protein [Bacillota bacterium]
MKFADQVYSFYRDQLLDSEEDAIGIVLSVLSGHSRTDVLKLIQSMGDEELLQMVSVYLLEALRAKIDEEKSLQPSGHTAGRVYH